MTDFTLSTLRSIYISNEKYNYPVPWLKKSGVGEARQGFFAGDYMPAINTGWHILPNMLWGHIVSPRQWWEMMIKYEALRVNSISCRLFNPIPIQTALAFQGTSTFPAFNNTVYALGYTDDIYETPWFDWWSRPFRGSSSSSSQVDQYYEWNPAYKEGLIPKKLSDRFDKCNEACTTRLEYDDDKNTPKYPKYYPTKVYQTDTSTLVQDELKYRRQILPIYWYHFCFKQYQNTTSVTKDWTELSSNFEYSYTDISGMFWDPLNRPDELMELRPGKNMIEYSWHVHPSDSDIWFNTDRLAALTPYGRSRPIDVDPGAWNMPLRPQNIDPRGPGNEVSRQKYLREVGLIKCGEELGVGLVMMAPETHMSLPDWRRWPVVPPRWFYKEIQQSNPWALCDITTRVYSSSVVGNQGIGPSPSTGGSEGASVRAGDVEITGPAPDFKFPGTEYEMHKYPPTQWFIKAIPLFDDAENPIRVEMQMFMHIEINITGKPRRSSIYGPTWGPIEPMNIYSVNMDTSFGENYMRTRSGGARRTWYNPEEQQPWREPLAGQGMELCDIYPENSKYSKRVCYFPGKDMAICDVSRGPTPCKPYSHIYAKSQTPAQMLITISRDSDKRVIADHSPKHTPQ